jgi:hypothetical protein
VNDFVAPRPCFAETTQCIKQLNEATGYKRRVCICMLQVSSLGVAPLLRLMGGAPLS